MAKKKPKRRDSRSNRSRLRSLAKKLRKETPFADTRIVYQPTGEISMSDALSVLMEPFLDHADTLNGHRNLAALAAIAWNTTLLPPEIQAEGLDMTEHLQHMPAGSRAAMKELVTTMIERKREFFPDVNRFIISYEVTDMGRGNWHLSVASTLSPDSSES